MKIQFKLLQLTKGLMLLLNKDINIILYIINNELFIYYIYTRTEYG